MMNGGVNMRMFEGKRILIIGGTGSLGRALVRRLLSNKEGQPRKVIVFSRDENKQHNMRVEYMHKHAVTDEVIYRNFEQRLEFHLGDIRDFHSVVDVLRDIDIVFNAAALKQVPSCEYFPYQSVMTNVIGAENIVRGIQEYDLPVKTVVGISTDKACEPVNVMGMTKALQERIFMQANMRCPHTRFICVRYGNVLGSRGSVIPLFCDQIKKGGPVTITSPEMTRFLITLDEAVDAVFSALKKARRGEIFVPLVRSVKVTDIVAILIGRRPIKTIVTGIRPGEKIHEVLISEEECHRAIVRKNYCVIQSLLPEIKYNYRRVPILNKEYSSANNIMSRLSLVKLFKKYMLTANDNIN